MCEIFKTSSVTAWLNSPDRGWREILACPTSRWDSWRRKSFVAAPHRPSSPACRLVCRGVRSRSGRCRPRKLLQSPDPDILRHREMFEAVLKTNNSVISRSFFTFFDYSPVSKSSSVLVSSELSTFVSSSELSISRPITSCDINSFSLNPPTPVSSELS